MKLLNILPFLAAASSVAASTFWESSQSSLADKPSVPGDNPLVFCKDPSDYLLTVDFVDLDPNPPKPASTLKIVANGTLSKDIDEGATVYLVVKYGLITLIKQSADLCENLQKVNMTCPVEKGPVSIVTEAEIPKQVPPGKYSVFADVKTVDEEEVTCMESTIVFNRPGSGNTFDL